MTVFIVCYALTSFVGGYVSGGYFARNDGKNWIKAMVATATVFPLTFFGIASILNTIAIVYHSLAAVSCLGNIDVTLLRMAVLWHFLQCGLLCLVLSSRPK